MSDTNRVKMLYGIEGASTYGTSPTGSGSYSTLRLTGESMHQETSTITSAEIRADRQIADVVRSNLSVAGDTGFELSYSFAELLLAAVMSDQAAQAFTGTITFTPGAELIATASGSKFTEDGIGGNFDEMSPGQWILTAGFNDAANNGYFKIKSITGTAESMVMEVYGTLVDESASTTPTMTQGGQVVNGAKQRSYTIQRVHEDIDTATSGRSAAYNGCMIDGMTLSATTEAVVTGSFSWIGAKGESNNTELGSDHVDATTNDVMNSIDDVDGVMEGANYDPQNITAFTMALGNNLRPRLEIGTLGAVAIGTGTCNVSGTFQRYYSDSTMIDKYLNFNDSALAIVFDDVDGNAYCFDFPKIIYTSAQRVAGGQNQDLIADMSWEAVRSDTQYNPADGSGDVDEGCTIRITKWTGLGSSG